MKRRITVVLDEKRLYLEHNFTCMDGITVESAENVPDPDRVQEFSVRIVTKATEPALTVGQVKWLIQIRYGRIKDITVTEVQS